MQDFVRVGSSVPKLFLAKPKENAKEILQIIDKAIKNNVQILNFPNMCIVGATIQDLVLNNDLLKDAEETLTQILFATKDSDMLVFLSLPVAVDNRVLNIAVAVANGEIITAITKSELQNNCDFLNGNHCNKTDKNHISTIKLCDKDVEILNHVVIKDKNNKELQIGITLGEDILMPSPISDSLALAGATIIVNLNATAQNANTKDIKNSIIEHSKRLKSAYIYTSPGLYESSADQVFGGTNIIAENGELLAEDELFLKESSLICADVDVSLLTNLRRKNFYGANNMKQVQKISTQIRKRVATTLKRPIEKKPFLAENTNYDQVLNWQGVALARRFLHTGSKKAIMPVSGGLDSTLALIATAYAFDYLEKDRKNIIAITMPGFGTSTRTYNNAKELIRCVGATFREIDIKASCHMHFEDIGYDKELKDLVYENAQARERTQILMDIANMEDGLVIGTGSLSEIALGFSTFGGDHLSMYNVNCSLAKTLIQDIVKYLAIKDKGLQDVLTDIVSTPISPELLPASTEDDGELLQKTEELVGPYILNDFFMYHMLKNNFGEEKIVFLATIAFKDIYTKDEIKKQLKAFYKRFYNAQFKRNAMPDGPAVTGISLSPRGYYMLPSDISF